jgi:hypothetical protein
LTEEGSTFFLFGKAINVLAKLLDSHVAVPVGLAQFQTVASKRNSVLLPHLAK